MKSAIATSIQAGVLGSIKSPQSFIWVAGLLLGFFGLKNELGEVLLGVLLLRLELSVTVQWCYEGRTGKLSVSPPTSASVEPADDLGGNENRNGGETSSKL
jgi:hypothetical protein